MRKLSDMQKSRLTSRHRDQRLPSLHLFTEDAHEVHDTTFHDLEFLRLVKNGSCRDRLKLQRIIEQ